MTPLHCAVRRGDNDEVRRLIQLNLPVDYPNEPLLNEAASSKRASAETCLILLRNGADANATDRLGRPPLFVAKDMETMRILVEHGANPHHVSDGGYNVLSFVEGLAEAQYLVGLGVDPNIKSDYGETPLSRAMLYQGPELTQFLLTHGADPALPDWSPLMLAVAMADLGEVERLLAEVGVGNEEEAFWSPWHQCIRLGNIRVAELFVRHGVDVKAPMERDFWPLISACEAGQTEMAKWLVGQGADIDQPSEFGDTALMAAAAAAKPDLVAWLLEQGANPNLTTDTDGDAMTNCTEIECVRLLVGAGANIDFINGEGEFLLRAAAKAGDVAFVEGLLALGADPNQSDHGDSALTMAAAFDEREIVRILLDAGADPNYRDLDDDTALHCVKSAVVARMLLDAGADPEVRNIVGRTPADVAVWSEVAAALGTDPTYAASHGLLQAAFQGNADLVAHFLRLGADPNFRTDWSATPLMNAAESGSLSAVEALLQAGAEAANADDSGNNALHYQAGQSSVQFGVDLNMLTPEKAEADARAIVERLTAIGLSPSDRNGQGLTPLAIAVLTGQTGIASALTRYATGSDLEAARRLADEKLKGDKLTAMLNVLS